MSDTAAAVVEAYYDALRRGEPLEPYFVADDATVKFGLSEALFGFDAVADALAEQTATTTDWTIESDRLAVTEYGEYATFADEVVMAWTDTETRTDRRFETRWSGTLVRRDAVDGGSKPDGDEAGTDGDEADEDEADEDEAGADGDDPAWLFRSMHVSTADEL